MAANIVIRGGFRTTVQVFNQGAAEIIVYGNVRHNGKDFKQLPLLRLTIEAIGADQEADVRICDEYSRFIPYLKPIKNFRKFLIEELVRLQSNVDEFVCWGIEEYLIRLRTYSENSVMIREVRTACNQLKENKVGQKQLLELLRLLGKESVVEAKFIMK